MFTSRIRPPTKVLYSKVLTSSIGLSSKSHWTAFLWLGSTGQPENQEHFSSFIWTRGNVCEQVCTSVWFYIRDINILNKNKICINPLKFKLQPKILTAPWGVWALQADGYLPHFFIISLPVSSYKFNFYRNKVGGVNNDLNRMKISSQSLQYANRSVIKEFLCVWERSHKHIKWNCCIFIPPARTGMETEAFIYTGEKHKRSRAQLNPFHYSSVAKRGITWL